MSGITGINNSTADLFQWLAQAESGTTDPTLLAALTADTSSTAATDAESSATNSSSSDATSLQAKIQTAVSAALQGAEEAGGTDLKDVIYSALVGVLKDNSIDPKTFKPLAGTDQDGDSGNADGSQPAAIDATTSYVLAQVLAALGAATAANNPVNTLLGSQDNSQTSNDLFSLLSAASTNGQASSDFLSQLTAADSNNQDLLGFLFDSGQ